MPKKMIISTYNRALISIYMSELESKSASKAGSTRHNPVIGDIFDTIQKVRPTRSNSTRMRTVSPTAK